MRDIIALYEIIAKVKDESTRRLLYMQFVSKYFPEAYNVLISSYPQGDGK